MLRNIKPKNARSKRALDARLPKDIEDPRTTVFVRGTHTGQVLNDVMRDLMALKRPHAISFSKKNDIHPFDTASTSTASLEFWANKNDASMFVIGQTTKKRPNGLTLVRMFDNRVLDMLEVGVESFVSMADIKTPKSTPGHKPLMHFASDLFDTNPRFAQLKSMLIALFNGEVIDSICLAGLEYVISVSLGPSVPAPATMYPNLVKEEDLSSLPTIHLRSYTTRLLASGTKIPRVELTPMGPSLDMRLRRHTPPDPELLKLALKTPKLKKTDIEKGLGKKRKNIEVDEMGDLRGQIHVGKQDLGKLQTRKMKGLKGGDGAVEEQEGPDGEEEEEEEQDGQQRKKRRRQST
ncbi:Brix domain-containing protein [Mycena albidolilacea]|uniref:Ribosome production factor 2 homolog n=1 Tax=Mycena albidolilacea TaxID=1033008 RepID=A0AAD7ACU8_9AGAR|nr:Brix domain-containing protein [Mycena albidolilacea]